MSLIRIYITFYAEYESANYQRLKFTEYYQNSNFRNFFSNFALIEPTLWTSLTAHQIKF